MDETVDVAVVGGGLGGLCCAALLGRAGRKVTLLDEGSTLGGRARSTQKQGFWFNLGAHALYRGGPAREVLDGLGVEYSGHLPTAAHNLAQDGGRLHTLPRSLGTMLSSSLLPAGAKLELARLLVALPRLETRSLDAVPLAAWVEGRLRSPGARKLALALFRVATYVGDAERCSAGAALRQLALAARHNVLYLDGGWQPLVDGAAAAATEAGVALLERAKVEALTREERGFSLAISGGRRLRAAAVVLAVPPADAARLAGVPALSDEVRALAPARVACLDVALSALPNPRANFVLGVDRPTYFSVASASAALAPQGGALVHLMKYLGPLAPDAARDQPELEAQLDLLQPGWREKVVHHRFLPNLIASNATPEAARGGRRPEVAAAPGLYLVGDWVGEEGHLLDASLASAREVARRLTWQGALRRAG